MKPNYENYKLPLIMLDETNIEMPGTTIKNCKCMKLLGVYFDFKLTFCSHIIC